MAIGVQDEPEIRRHERAHDGAAVHHAGDLLEPFGELDMVDGRRNRGKRAEDLFDLYAALERCVPLRVERLGLRHSSSHPQDDDRVGRRRLLRRGGRTREYRLAARQRRECGGSRRPHESASTQLRVDQAFFTCHSDSPTDRRNESACGMHDDRTTRSSRRGGAADSTGHQ
jgi:hypothetical protein